MRLLVDTDAFCKLGVGGLLEHGLGALGATYEETGRLPALPNMLRRGKLAKRLGGRGESLHPIAQQCPMVPDGPRETVDVLVGVRNIDPGEAQLFSHIATADLLLVSGDKRALRALAQVEALREHVAHKIVVLEALLMRLCDQRGPATVHAGIEAAKDLDTMLMACAASDAEQLPEALGSYFGAFEKEVAPLQLWRP